jgi:hypothetical protein
VEYLSPLDASFLDAEDEDRHASLAIASIAVIDGPAPSQAEFAAAIRGRLPLIPRYRQKVRRVPFDLGRPVWVDDPDLIGLSPSTFAATWSGWPPVLLAVVALVLGAALLASIGTAQWLILRRILDRTGRWIVATAIAWTAGLASFLVFAMPLWRPGQPMALIMAIGVAGGLLMAAVTSAITGHALRRMIA